MPLTNASTCGRGRDEPLYCEVRETITGKKVKFVFVDTQIKVQKNKV